MSEGTEDIGLGEFADALKDPEAFKSFVERHALTNENGTQIAGELAQLTFRRLWDLHHK